MRVAERIYQELKDKKLNKTAFYLGNIAIDSGKVNEDQTIFPPRDISHWLAREGTHRDCRYEDFYKTYLIKQEDEFAYSFYLGCTSHLINDSCFKLNIKQDWYDQDFLYLKEHTNFEPLKLLEEIHDFKNDYLPWFDTDAIQLKLDELVNFYKDVPTNLERYYEFLTKKKMDNFVFYSTEYIIKEIDYLCNTYN